MTTIVRGLGRNVSQLVAVALICTLYGFSQPAELSDSERASLAARFSFTQLHLSELAGFPTHSQRAVHPSLKHIAAWISSVGAAVALNDLDKDGLPNDVCYVDTRIDQIIVAPVPGTPPRFEPFALGPEPLPYDPATMAPMGCLPGDLNEDGRMDLLVYYWGRTPIIFLHKKGVESNRLPLTGSSYVRRELISGGARWFTNAATQADLDGDGHIDLVIGNYFQDDAQILDANATGREQLQASMSLAFNGGRDHLLLWAEATAGREPTVRFNEVDGVLDEQIAQGWTLAIGAADLDGDLLPELYFANDFGPDRLLHNLSRPGQLKFALLEGRRFFSTPKSKVLGHDSFKGMGVDFGDLNGDGWLDIYVSNIAAEYSLEESHFVFLSTGDLKGMQEGFAPYVDQSEWLNLSRSGWGWEARLDDFDNDGVLEALQATGFVKGAINRWPELHELAMGNDELLYDPRSWPHFQAGADLSGHQPNPFFVRAKNGRYYDLASALGLDELQVSRGIATADVDGDGDLDFAVANQWEPSNFYRNNCPNCKAFLGLHLFIPLEEGGSSATIIRAGHPNPETPGRPAIGAVATVHLPNERQLVAHVDGGNGHSGKRSPDLHFGLGEFPVNTKFQVDLHWRDPNGQVQRETMHLSSGWYTVLLGWPDPERRGE